MLYHLTEEQPRCLTTYLHVGSSLGHGLNGVGTNGIDDLLKLGRLDIRRLLGFIQFHVVLNEASREEEEDEGDGYDDDR